MAVKAKNVVVNNAKPFENNALNRILESNVLTRLVADANGGGVIAVNGAWGTGKSTFIEIWRKQLEHDGCNVIYFNAWENDYITDPLVGLIGEIITLSQFDAPQIVSKKENWLNKIANAATVVL